MLHPPFVGRVDEREKYQTFLANQTSWVLIVTGMGGIGKSSLLRYVKERPPFESADTHVVKINLAEMVEPDELKFLKKLSFELKSCCDLQLVENFDRAEQEGRRTLDHATMNVLQMLIVSDQGNSTGNKLEFILGLTNFIQERHVQVREQVVKAFYDQVETFDRKQLVIMVDTCEWLSEENNLHIGEWIINALLPDLHNRMCQKQQQCSVVLASRIQPKLESLDEHEIMKIELGMLKEEEVKQYLHAIGIEDPALCSYIYGFTYGHPHCLSIVNDLWLNNGPFPIENIVVLQDLFNKEAKVNFIDERILDKYLVTPFYELTRYSTFLRRFNQPLLEAIFPEFFPGKEASKIFDQFVRYPYIKYERDGFYSIHNLLREIITSYLQVQEQERWQDYHERAFDQLHPKPDCYYHALAWAEELGMPEWKRAMQEAYNKQDRDTIASLINLAYDRTLKFTQKARKERDEELTRCLFF